MDIVSKYNNYDLHPATVVKGFDNCIWDGKENVTDELKERVGKLLKANKKVVVCMDMYPGVEKEDILDIVKGLAPVKVFDMEAYAKSEEELNREFYEYITDDRVFGIICLF